MIINQKLNRKISEIGTGVHILNKYRFCISEDYLLNMVNYNLIKNERDISDSKLYKLLEEHDDIFDDIFD